jgi:hypothetical protein
VLGLLELRGAREDDRMLATRELLEEVVRALERPHIVDELAVEPLLGVADRVAELALDLVAGDRGDELIAAHADVAVDAPDRRAYVVLAERAVPDDRVLVVGVDEGPVDVEDRGRAHAAALPRGGRSTRLGPAPIGRADARRTSVPQ